MAWGLIRIPVARGNRATEGSGEVVLLGFSGGICAGKDERARGARRIDRDPDRVEGGREVLPICVRLHEEDVSLRAAPVDGFDVGGRIGRL